MTPENLDAARRVTRARAAELHEFIKGLPPTADGHARALRSLDQLEHAEKADLHATQAARRAYLEGLVILERQRDPR